MTKRKIVYSLLMVVIISFLAFGVKDTLPLDSKVYSTEVTASISKCESRFLSDEYFCELDSIFQRISKEDSQRIVLNKSRKIVATAVINKMMGDLERHPNDLINHKNFERFFELFDKNVRELDDVTERVHFFRNTLNSYSGAPVAIKDMIDLAARSKWKLFSAKFHRFNYGDTNGALNVKFISSEGRFEAIYNTGTGKIVTDPANMGTYNYAPGSANPIDFYFHDKFDKKPWRKWGNVKGFSYQDIMSLKSEHGTDEATNEKHHAPALQWSASAGRGTIDVPHLRIRFQVLCLL